MKVLDKKELINNKNKVRKNIISSSLVFRNKLSGKYVLYVFDDNTYIEVFYRKNSFSHLTGVKTNLNAFEFYNKAVSKKLTFAQFSFDKKSHPYDLAKKKTDRLSEIDKFISTDLIVLRDFSTENAIYKFSLTDTDLTLCFCENFDNKTNKKIDEYFIPASFRVGDNSVKRSKECCFVKHIFIKKSKNINYHTLCYGDENKINELPDEIKNKISVDKISENKESA